MNNNNLVDVNTLADLFNKDVRTIQLWASEQGMPKEGRGKYNLFNCIRWYVKYTDDKIVMLESSGDEKLHGLRMDGQHLANKEKSLKLRRLMGELVPVDAVRIAWVGEATIFRKALNAMGNKLNAQLDGITDKYKRLEIITREIREVLNMIGDLKINEDTEDTILDELEEESLNESSNEISAEII